MTNIVNLSPTASSRGARNQNYMSIAGATPTDSSYLLDGAELTDNLGFFNPTLYLEDAIEEAQIQVAGVSPSVLTHRLTRYERRGRTWTSCITRPCPWGLAVKFSRRNDALPPCVTRVSTKLTSPGWS